MKKLLFLLLVGFSSFAHADYDTTLEVADCDKIASSGGMAGALVGSTAGGATGAVAGRMLFGRKGGWIGGLIGGIAGGAAGENMTSTKTYRCVIKFKDTKGKTIVQEVVGQHRSIGERVKVYESSNGLVVR